MLFFFVLVWSIQSARIDNIVPQTSLSEQRFFAALHVRIPANGIAHAPAFTADTSCYHVFTRAPDETELDVTRVLTRRALRRRRAREKKIKNKHDRLGPLVAVRASVPAGAPCARRHEMRGVRAVSTRPRARPVRDVIVSRRHREWHLMALVRVKVNVVVVFTVFLYRIRFIEFDQWTAESVDDVYRLVRGTARTRCDLTIV